MSISREIKITVSEKQEKFLRRFINTDTMGTNRPLFFVLDVPEGVNREDLSEYDPTGWIIKAFFFSIEAARDYLDYQKHNLRDPIIYGQSPGYSNYGDWEPFYDLLRSIGFELVKNSLEGFDMQDEPLPGQLALQL